MKAMKRLLFAVIFAVSAITVQAQDASTKVQSLFDKYGNIPNYKVNVTYVSANDKMGFTNTQEGVLVVEGDKYILKFGPNETWLNDGKTEYVGTKEEDHSQIMYFCPGNNVEAIVDFGALMTFYGSKHAGTVEGNTLKLKPSSEMPYKELHIETSGDDITSIKAIDDFGTIHTYSLSGFSTNTKGTKFVINPKEYEESIDERSNCK